jgi:hypothetical protein
MNWQGWDTPEHEKDTYSEPLLYQVAEKPWV